MKQRSREDENQEACPLIGGEANIRPMAISKSLSDPWSLIQRKTRIYSQAVPLPGAYENPSTLAVFLHVTYALFLTHSSTTLLCPQCLLGRLIKFTVHVYTNHVNVGQLRHIQPHQTLSAYFKICKHPESCVSRPTVNCQSN